MTRAIDADYSETYMLPPCVEDWIEPDNPTRFIRDFVDSLDLKQLGFRQADGGRGTPHYASGLLVKIWIYGWLNRIHRSRALERACTNNVELMWLSGRHVPDHNTLWRFWQNNRKSIGKLFKQSVKLAYRAGLVGQELHAVDGTKIPSASGRDGALDRKTLEKLQTSVDADIAAIDAANTHNDDEHENARLSEQLSDAKRRQQWIRECLAQMDRKECDEIIPHEPDANKVRTRDGVRWGYNAQAVVDAKAGIVVAQDVTTEQNDLHQLVPMLKEVQDNLGSFATHTVTDGGYATQEQLGLAAGMGADITSSLRDNKQCDNNPLHSYHFHYDPQQDVCICPATGEKLPYHHTTDAHGSHHSARIYRCGAGGTCPFARQCTKNKTGRNIEITAWREALVRQTQLQHDEDRRRLLRKRKVIVEPLFAHIKHAGQFRRFTLFSLNGARAQWSWACLMQNLKVLMKHFIGRNSPSKRALNRFSHYQHPEMRSCAI